MTTPDSHDGSTAPADPFSQSAASDRPRVLALVRHWSPDRERANLANVLVGLRELDAELVVLSRDGAWSFIPDGEQLDIVFNDRFVGDVATAAMLAGAGLTDAVFVVDGARTLRFAHDSTASLTTTLAQALGTARGAFATRERQTANARTLFTRRAWATSCLIAGCTSRFLGDCFTRAASVSRETTERAGSPTSRPSQPRSHAGPRLERKRLACGTGEVPACGSTLSRTTTTPCAVIGAPVSVIPRETVAAIPAPLRIAAPSADSSSSPS